jgi:hypothetical protein
MLPVLAIIFGILDRNCSALFTNTDCCAASYVGTSTTAVLQLGQRLDGLGIETLQGQKILLQAVLVGSEAHRHSFLSGRAASA